MVIFFFFLGIYISSLENLHHALVRHITQVFEVVDVDQCAQLCRTHSCRSFNFQQFGAEGPKRYCELSKLSRDQAPKQYVSRPGYTYYDDVSG